MIFLTNRAGIDGGGVFKEFLTSLAKEVFDTNRGLWLATNQNELYPNPHSYAQDCKSCAFVVVTKASPVCCSVQLELVQVHWSYPWESIV
jgi:hypothetical protein